MPFRRMRPDPGQRRSDTCRPSVLSARPFRASAPSPRTPAVRSAIHATFKLADLGVYGFDRHETTILAALVTEDPLLLVGRSGTGKTFLLNTLSEALGLEHRHYNASLISFDDLVGFPYPDEAHTTVRFLETPATVWGAESVLIDEISRCKPEHQNRLFSLVHERRLQGLPLEQTALSLGRDESVHVRPGRHRRLFRLRGARSCAGRPLCAHRDGGGLERSHVRAAGCHRGAVGGGARHAAERTVARGRGRMARAVPGAGERVPDAGHHVCHDGRQRAQRRQRPHLTATRTAARAQSRGGDDRRRSAVVQLVSQRARLQPAAPHLGPEDRRSRGRFGASRGVGCLA